MVTASGGEAYLTKIYFSVLDIDYDILGYIKGQVGRETLLIHLS